MWTWDPVCSGVWRGTHVWSSRSPLWGSGETHLLMKTHEEEDSARQGSCRWCSRPVCVPRARAPLVLLES